MAKAPANIRSIARGYTNAAVRVLVEVMNDPSAPPAARATAASYLLNRGWGPPPGAEKFVTDRREHYVYSIHERSTGKLIYIGKGLGQRARQSARRLSGRHRIRAIFVTEREALDFERRLIEAFRPHHNIVHNFQARRSA